MENQEPHCPDEELGNGGYQKSIRVPHTPCSHALPRTPESHLSLPGCSGPLPRLSSRSHSRRWGGVTVCPWPGPCCRPAPGGTSPARVCSCPPWGGFLALLPPCPSCCLVPALPAAAASAAVPAREMSPGRGHQFSAGTGPHRARRRAEGRLSQERGERHRGGGSGGICLSPAPVPSGWWDGAIPTAAGPGVGQGSAAGTRRCVSPRHRGYIGTPLPWEKKAPGAVPKCHTLLPVPPARAAHG